MRRPTVDERRALRAALVDVAPWVRRDDAGPRAVDAGSCPRCDAAPRLLPTCGPTAWTALCRDCALEVGPSGWCDGHAEEAAGLLAWAAGLSADWRDVVVLWWVASGEVGLDAAPDPAALPPRLAGLMPRGDPADEG